MRTVYYDMNDICTGAVGMFVRDAVMMPAGVTLCVASVEEKGETAFAEYAGKDVHFIFADDVPHISFYPLPRLDVFARTTGGLLATLNESSDVEGEAPIMLIGDDMRVYRAADNMMKLLSSSNWKDGVVESDEVRLYASREDAAEENEFVLLK